ncbi:MAG: hypothetical protein IPH45_08220 [Bacteroidales bacterium]|nr:hypothetical protein [Bacteroidales bacterium]
MDMILASQELLKDKSVKAESNGKHFLMGYSQGGWATLAALKEAEVNYTDKMTVTAASCGAGAYDIKEMSEYVLARKSIPDHFTCHILFIPGLNPVNLPSPFRHFLKSHLPQGFLKSLMVTIPIQKSMNNSQIPLPAW